MSCNGFTKEEMLLDSAGKSERITYLRGPNLSIRAMKGRRTMVENAIKCRAKPSTSYKYQ